MTGIDSDKSIDRGGADIPRDFGRDGVSGLVSVDRAMRARDVSRPSDADHKAAELVLADLLARVDGRRYTAGTTPVRS